jgi:hypothetical protein
LTLVTSLGFTFVACGDGEGSTVGGGASTAGGSRNTAGSLSLNDGGQAQPGTGGSGSGDDECSADFAAAELRPVHLAFAFDVSGSMGKRDLPYHDPELKWRPVVAATRAFFEADSSAGISASLTFFPAADDKCDATSYGKPDVALTALPASAFGEAIAAIDPEAGSPWRGGTPTLAVVQGTFEYLGGLATTRPDMQHALVLVTDGYPQGCDEDDDEIASVAAAIQDESAQFPTYVIGVKNPDGGPDTVSDLEALAVAGGTETAIIIDTGNPDQTAADLGAAIGRIRERSVSCDAAIPQAPGGNAFDPDKVNVSMQLGGNASQLGYDQDCEAEGAWRYDNADAPTSIVLCPSTCQAVQQDASAELSVEFGCDTRPVVK